MRSKLANNSRTHLFMPSIERVSNSLLQRFFIKRAFRPNMSARNAGSYQAAAGAPGWRRGAAAAKASIARHASAIRAMVGSSLMERPIAAARKT